MTSVCLAGQQLIYLKQLGGFIKQIQLSKLGWECLCTSKLVFVYVLERYFSFVNNRKICLSKNEHFSILKYVLLFVACLISSNSRQFYILKNRQHLELESRHMQISSWVLRSPFHFLIKLQQMRDKSLITLNKFCFVNNDNRVT